MGRFPYSRLGSVHVGTPGTRDHTEGNETFHRLVATGGPAMRRGFGFASWLAIVATTLLMTACSSSTVARLDDVPVPPGARKEIVEGAYEVPLDLTVAELRRDLKEKYGKAEVAIYTLPGDAEWSAVSAFYASQLRARGLGRDECFPADRARYKVAVWGRDGWLNKQAVAVALLDDGPMDGDERQKLLVILLAGR